MLNTTLGAEWLVVDRETAGPNPEAGIWLDADQFRQHVVACETHAHPPVEACAECLPLLEEAVALYRDDFMAGFTLPDSPGFDEFQLYQTEGLKDELAGVLDRLASYCTSQGNLDAAMGYARRWLALDPLAEPAHRHLMASYAQAGRHSTAVRQYRTCLRALDQELGLPPSAETTALYERIQAERTHPAEPEVSAPETPPPSVALLPAFLAEEEAPRAVERPVFVARETELARLDAYLEAALSGRGQVAFVIGGPGRGKTALIVEFARRAMAVHHDLLVAMGNCNAYFGLGDPYLPFREVLAMLTGDVEARWAAGSVSRRHARRLWEGLGPAAQALVDHGPSLIGTLVPGGPLLSRTRAVAPQDARWLQELTVLSEREGLGYSGLEQRAMFEQYANVVRALAARSPLLLLLDDLQWADAASIGLLFHLGRGLEGARILVVGAYRPEEVAIGRDGERHPLKEVLTEFKRRFGDAWIDLAQVDAPEGRQFVDAFLDTESNQLGESFRTAFFQRTGGHPLFTIELLRAIQERGDLVQDVDGRWIERSSLDWERLPSRVEAVIEARVDRLDQELRDILTVASVEGERFTAQAVARVQDVDERAALRVLSQELGIRQRLVREEEEVRVGGRFLSRYRFAHALFQQYLYDGLGGGERRLLHGEVAMVMEGLYGDQTEDIVAQLAHHYAEAGQAEKAIEYALRAGDQARLAYAHDEAVGYFERALTLLDELPPSESGRDWRFAALKGLGQTYFAAGELAGAEENLRGAIVQGQEIGKDPRELARLYHHLGETLWWQGRYRDLVRTGEEGLALLGDDTESVEAALMNDKIALGHRNLGNSKKYQEMDRRNAQLIERLPYSPQLFNAYNHIMELFRDFDRDVEKAMKWLRTLEEEVAARQDYAWQEEAVHSGIGETLLRMGDLRGSIPRIQRALKGLAQIGDAKHEAWWLPRMFWAFLALGDLEKARGYADRALETARIVGFGYSIRECYHGIGVIALCQADWEEAIGAFEKADQIARQIVHHWAMWIPCRLGQAYLAQGDRKEALKRFQETLAVAGPEVWRGYIEADPPPPCRDPSIVNTLSGLEAAYDDPDAFRAFCRRFQEDHPETGDSPFVQWFLEPVGAVGPEFQGRETPPQKSPTHHDEFATPLSPDWAWEDPFNDCSFTVGKGLEMHAVNGRGLWRVNLSAPRMLRPVSGSWVAETVCTPVSVPASGAPNPTIGGLLLWKNKDNFLRLDRGACGEQDVFFGGYLENQGVIIGRGRLPLDDSKRVFLRLERVGDRVDAYCSADGEEWFTVGHIAFPVEDPLQVGLHAIGEIDRTVYHGAYPDGTAIWFDSFQLWEA